MLNALEAHCAELDTSPQLIYELVSEIVVPHFDFKHITRFAMGRNWRKASVDQRKDLVAAFQRLLVRTYAKALLNYSGQKIKTQPPRQSSHEG